jgi:hypothetical protein
MSKNAYKVCFVCHKKLDIIKDRAAFVELGNITACKKHHGVEKWAADARKAEEKAEAIAKAAPAENV